MKEYRVTWKIDLDAESPRGAAKQARVIQRDLKSTATVFSVINTKTGEPFMVDLFEEQTYHFSVTLAGTGDTPEDAWQDAVEGFSMDPGPTPEPKEYTVAD